MTRVRGVTSDSSFDASRFGSSPRLSTNTIVAPWRTNASALETNVYDGTITSSPGPTPVRMAAISSASVHEVVSRHFPKP